MKKIKISLVILILVCGLYSQSNWARGGHGGGGHGGGHFGGHGGFRGYYGGGLYYGFGFPYYGYGYGYGYGFPYYSPSLYIGSTPPPIHYIQQPPVPVIQYPPGYWYYCSNPQGYYPEIKGCPTVWQQVPPLPSSPP